MHGHEKYPTDSNTGTQKCSRCLGCREPILEGMKKIRLKFSKRNRTSGDLGRTGVASNLTPVPAADSTVVSFKSYSECDHVPSGQRSVSACYSSVLFVL